MTEPGTRGFSKAVVVVAVALAALLAACGAEPELRGMDPAELPEFHLEEVLRLGVVEGREGEEFGLIRGLTITDHDELWVIETRRPMLRRFAADGTFLGTSGRDGQGPGEFQEVRDLEPLPDGGVFVLDSRLGRINRFDADGSFVEDWPLPRGTRHQLRHDRSSGVLYVEAQTDTLVQVAARPVLKTTDERRELEERIASGPRRQSISLEPEKPIIAELRLDQDDRVWVRLRTEAEKVDRSGLRWREHLRLWHVWEPDGTPVGVVRLELGVHWMEARGQHLWVATLGEMGEPQIIQYRMVER